MFMCFLFPFMSFIPFIPFMFHCCISCHWCHWCHVISLASQQPFAHSLMHLATSTIDVLSAIGFPKLPRATGNGGRYQSAKYGYGRIQNNIIVKDRQHHHKLGTSTPKKKRYHWPPTKLNALKSSWTGLGNSRAFLNRQTWEVGAVFSRHSLLTWLKSGTATAQIC